jgi:hypothetical protein
MQLQALAKEKWIADLGSSIATQDLSISAIGEGKLRGIVCNGGLDSSRPAVTIPASLTLEVTNTRPPTPFPKFVSQSLWEKSLWFQRLAFKLLYEYYVVPNEKKVWFEQLPKSFSTPFHWNTESLQNLQYLTLQDKVLQQQREWKAFYDEWKLQAKIGNTLSFEQFVWAMECVSSRAFSGVYEGSSAQERRAIIAFTGVLTGLWPVLHLSTFEQALSGAAIVTLSIIVKDLISSKMANLKRYVVCPVIDMFNHDSRSTSDVAYNYFSDSFSLTTQAYTSGQQVFINYGKQSNDRLLQVYGFVEVGNPNEVYDFGHSLLELLLGPRGEQLSLLPFSTSQHTSGTPSGTRFLPNA